MDARQHGQIVSFIRCFPRAQQLPPISALEDNVCVLETETERLVNVILVDVVAS
jgi:hypothetical protein